jgi:hypothetical protein
MRGRGHPGRQLCRGPGVMCLGLSRHSRGTVWLEGREGETSGRRGEDTEVEGQLIRPLDALWLLGT